MMSNAPDINQLIHENALWAIERHSIMRPDAADWIAPICARHMASGQGMKPAFTEVRSQGTPLTSAEKAALGLRGNVKIGQTFADALTDKGRQDPIRAAQVVVHRAIVGASFHRQLAEYRKMAASMNVKFCLAEMNASATSEFARQCKAAKLLSGIEFNINEVPIFPIGECDSDYCVCMLTVNVKSVNKFLDML